MTLTKKSVYLSAHGAMFSKCLMVRWISLLGILAMLTGCATSTLSPSEAQDYASLNPSEFLAKRFNDLQSKQLDGHVVFVAYYTEMNDRQLYRPALEVSRYCQAQGGTPVLTRIYEGDPLSRVFRNPVLDAVIAKKVAESLNYSPQMKYYAISAAIDDALLANRRYDRTGAQKRFREANQNGMFGEFTCFASADRSAKKWIMLITPIGFMPHDPNSSLSSHKLVLDIVPINLLQ